MKRGGYVALVLSISLVSLAFAEEEVPPCFSDNPPPDCPTPEEREAALKEMEAMLQALNDMKKAAKEWNEKYESVYYACVSQTLRGNDLVSDPSEKVTLEIFQSFNGGVRFAGMKIKPAEYQEAPPYRGFLVYDQDYNPTGQRLIMMPDGQTVLVDKEDETLMHWVCEPAPWPESEE